jgi:RES domain-containing protein
VVRIFRIADQRHPIWDGTGAALVGGRWNSPGRPVIYGALSFAGAMLEVLVHSNIGRVPTTQRCVVVEVPEEVPVERLDLDALAPGWDAPVSTDAKTLGDRWLSEARSAVLLVPSVVARLEWNALVNPQHPAAALLRPSEPQPVIWDRRLFEKGAGTSA